MGRISKLTKMLLEGRVGYKLNEVMSGVHEFTSGYAPSGERPMSFEVSWGSENVLGLLNPFKDESLINNDFVLTHSLEGTISIDGLCDKAPCTGTLEVDYLDKHAITYTINFSEDGRAYEYVGEKRNIWPCTLPESHTTCYGVLRDKETNEVISESTLHFRLNTLLSFLASFRLE